MFLPSRTTAVQRDVHGRAVLITPLSRLARLYQGQPSAESGHDEWVNRMKCTSSPDGCMSFALNRTTSNSDRTKSYKRTTERWKVLGRVHVREHGASGNKMRGRRSALTECWGYWDNAARPLLLSCRNGFCKPAKNTLECVDQSSNRVTAGGKRVPRFHSTSARLLLKIKLAYRLYVFIYLGCKQKL